MQIQICIWKYQELEKEMKTDLPSILNQRTQPCQMNDILDGLNQPPWQINDILDGLNHQPCQMNAILDGLNQQLCQMNAILDGLRVFVFLNSKYSLSLLSLSALPLIFPHSLPAHHSLSPSQFI